MIAELSRSGRSRCYVCCNVIPFKIPRVLDRAFICYNCAEKYFEDEMKRLNEEIKAIGKFKIRWKKFIKEHSKEIIIANLK